MNTVPEAPFASAPITSQREFAQLLRLAVRAAVQRRSRLLLCCDADFAAWPLDDVAVLDDLTRWLQLPQRQVMLVAQHFDGFAAAHARFMSWYRHWSHAVSARQPPQDRRSELPCLLLADSGPIVHLVDPPHWRGCSDDDPRLVHQWRKRLDVFLQQCEPALPVTTLGL